MDQSLPTEALLSLLSALRQAMALECGRAADLVDVGDQAAFEAAVVRHRLAVVLAPHAERLGFPPDTTAVVRREARHAQMAAMTLIALAREAMEVLAAAGVPVLVIKGPALAVQTTGQDTLRGSGDLDLFVAPGDLARARKALEAIGFRQAPGLFPQQLESFWGRYSRWASYELSLLRGNQLIELHWSLAPCRAPLPGFPAAWQEREWINLGGQAMATLSLRHAFLHACAHAAKDQWMSLRSLVDIDRLARLQPHDEHARVRRLTCVRLSCATAHQAIGSPYLLAYTDPNRWDCQWALKRAQWAQMRSEHLEADGPWRPWHWAATIHRLAQLSPSPLDWLRTVAFFSLPPRAFSNPETGQDLGLAGMVRVRLGHLRERLRESGRLPLHRDQL